MYAQNNHNLYLVTAKHITLFPLLLVMKKSLKAKVDAHVKVYLIPKDKLEIVDGKPKLSDEFLVYDSKKEKKGG